LTDEAALGRFIESVRTVTPRATGGAIGVYEGKRAIVSAFQQAFALAVVAIVMLLLALWRSAVDTTLVWCRSARRHAHDRGPASSSFSFNFADVNVLPLLFGLGVNSGSTCRTPLPRGRPGSGVERAPHVRSSTANTRRQLALGFTIAASPVGAAARPRRRVDGDLHLGSVRLTVAR
jgi:hypothetical protein